MKVTDIYLYVILAAFVLIVAISVWRFQRSAHDFNLIDLLMENGRASRLAVAFAITLAITSWVMLKLTVDGKMTEGYLMSYGGMWIAPIIGKMFATNQPAPKEP